MSRLAVARFKPRLRIALALERMVKLYPCGPPLFAANPTCVYVFMLPRQVLHKLLSESALSLV